MKTSWSRILTIARREFLATVRRKAFVFTVVGTPAYFAFVMWISSSTLRVRCVHFGLASKHPSRKSSMLPACPRSTFPSSPPSS